MGTHTKPAMPVKSNPGHAPLTPEEKEDIRRQVRLLYNSMSVKGAWVHQYIEAICRELVGNHNSPKFQEVSQVIRETSMEIQLRMTQEQ